MMTSLSGSKSAPLCLPVLCKRVGDCNRMKMLCITTTTLSLLLLFLLWCRVVESSSWRDAARRRRQFATTWRQALGARGGARREGDDNSSSSSSSSIFSSIVRTSTKALAATARGSTHLAADLVRPKEVAFQELVGWWRLDIALLDDDNDHAPPMTIQITPQGRVRLAAAGEQQEQEFPLDFCPASWPRSAKLKFGGSQKGGGGGGYIYECTVQRKLANLDILKLRGKIYVIRRFQGKVQVGTFVGRRRVVVMEDEDDEAEQDSEEFEEDEYDADEGYDDNDQEEEEEEVANQESDGQSEWGEED